MPLLSCKRDKQTTPHSVTPAKAGAQLAAVTGACGERDTCLHRDNGVGEIEPPLPPRHLDESRDPQNAFHPFRRSRVVARDDGCVRMA